MAGGGGNGNLFHKNNWLSLYNFIKNHQKGAILVEFAIAVPIILSLILYANDLAKIKQWNQRMDFATHCMANMFQSTENVTKKDVINVLHACRLAYTPDGIKSFQKWNNSKQHTLFQLGILCVTGTDTNKCKVKWFAWSQGGNFSHYTVATSGQLSSADSYAWNPFRSLTIGNEYASSAVYPSLTIESGDTKLLFVHVFCCQFNGLQDSWAKNILGLHVACPIAYKYSDSAKTYLQSVLVFTPKPGTFAPANPPA